MNDQAHINFIKDVENSLIQKILISEDRKQAKIKIHSIISTNKNLSKQTLNSKSQGSH